MWLRIVVSYVLLVTSAVFITIWPGRATAQTSVIDISWPNCNDNLQVLSADMGIVGGLGGLNFHKNPCLAKEQVFKTTDIYLNTGYAGIERARAYNSRPKQCSKDNEPCLAYNYGWAAADYAVNQTFKSGVMPRQVWLDVEFGNTWSDNAMINRVVIGGMHDRLVRLAPTGIYSYPFQWGVITADWHNGWPVWVATGSTKKVAAVKACQDSFTSGPVLLAQYTPKLDQNYICR